MRPAALVGGQLGYRWQAGDLGVRRRSPGRLGRPQGLNTSLFFGPGTTNRTKIDAFGLFTGQVGYAWNNVLWYVKGGAAVTETSTRATSRGGAPSTPPTKPAGAARSAPASKSALRRTGRSPSNTTTCSWATATSPCHCPAARSSRTDRISQDVDMGTVRVNYRWGGPVIAKY